MYPLDPKNQTPWWDYNFKIIVAFDVLHKAVNQLESLKESDCRGLKEILTNFASEMIIIINKHRESSERQSEVERLLKNLLKNRGKFRGEEDIESP
jgi:UDP-N-acetylglucosamine 2-epimerase